MNENNMFNENDELKQMPDTDLEQVQNKIDNYRAEINRLQILKESIKNTQMDGGAQPLVNQNSGRGQSQGKQLTLNTGHNPSHSSIPNSSTNLSFAPGNRDYFDNNHRNAAFVTNLLLALLVGFAGGAIATAIYIFMNLSHVTVSL